MAKCTITHACGHEHTYNLWGGSKEQDRKEKWLASQECPACRRASEEAARDAQNRICAELNRDSGAVPLTGTDGHRQCSERLPGHASLAHNASLDTDREIPRCRDVVTGFQSVPCDHHLKIIRMKKREKRKRGAPKGNKNAAGHGRPPEGRVRVGPWRLLEADVATLKHVSGFYKTQTDAIAAAIRELALKHPNPANKVEN